MASFVIQGLLIQSQCNYIKFTYKNVISIREDLQKDCLFIDFPQGIFNYELNDPRCVMLFEMKLSQSEYTKIKIPTINLNGLKFNKLIQEDHIFNQFIVREIEDIKLFYDSSVTYLLVPDSKLISVEEYLTIFNQHPLFKVKESIDFKAINNFSNILLRDTNVTLTSTNSFKFNANEYYEQYSLRSIDTMDSFIDQLKKVITPFGLQLVKVPYNEAQVSSNKLIYKITELDKRLFHKGIDPVLNVAQKHEATINFHLSCTDYKVYSDFCIRYQNLDFVSNFVEFITLDYYGNPWSASVWWEPIQTSFKSDEYSQDESGNVSYTADFECKLSYYIVKDEKVHLITKIIVQLIADPNQILSTIKIE